MSKTGGGQQQRYPLMAIGVSKIHDRPSQTLNNASFEKMTDTNLLDFVVFVLKYELRIYFECEKSLYAKEILRMITTLLSASI